ncbi:MAG TPA: sulfite exporter TauE/SafE family protein [Terriglobia bacterium]|nr:sulfite exporter TauE/SafE family protein [Terriglobia bacterium]
MNPITGLLAALGAVAALFMGGWTAMIRAQKQKLQFPNVKQIFVGAFTNFLDTLGIGSYATTTATYRLFRMVDDRIIPGTLNVGHTLPTVVQTFIYTTIIPVDVPTLFSMIGASILGAWLGAGVVARWPKRNVQIGMGVALLVAAGLMFMTQMKLFPGGGDALGVSGVKLMIAVGVNFVLGALMTLGIGLYAPCMILVSLLGMNPKAAFPIMMGSCAFLMPTGSIRFIREQSYHMRAALGLALGGIPGVLLAAYLVKELPLGIVRWLVIAVVVYTSISMLWSARATGEAAATVSPGLPQFPQAPFAGREQSTD